MATNKNITMRQFNGTDYDTLYPKTLGSQIASTVPVSAGGTGINVNPNIHVNLGAENTSNVFEVYPRPGVYGTLPVSHGGTGQTSLAALASAMGAAKIQTGSYVGTGTYGASNPNSLTFNFQPKLVGINNVDAQYFSYGQDGSTLSASHLVVWWIPGQTAYHRDVSRSVNFSQNGNSLSYWTDNTRYEKGETQYNAIGITYIWVAFG